MGYVAVTLRNSVLQNKNRIRKHHPEFVTEVYVSYK